MHEKALQFVKKKNYTVDQPTQIPSTCYSDHPSEHADERQGWRLCTNSTVDQPTQIASICSCKNTKGQVFTRSTRFLWLICSFIKQYINFFSIFFTSSSPEQYYIKKKKISPPNNPRVNCLSVEVAAVPLLDSLQSRIQPCKYIFSFSLFFHTLPLPMGNRTAFRSRKWFIKKSPLVWRKSMCVQTWHAEWR